MRVIFHGILRRLCPEVYDLKVDSPYEALTALVTQIPALAAMRNGEGYLCRVAGCDTLQDLFRPTDAAEIHVVPDYTVGKSKSSSWIQIGLGALLIVAAVIAAPVAPQLSVFLFSTGVSLIAGGLLALLAKSPSRDDNPDASKYLGEPGNTTANGTRIPIAYGVNRLYGHFLSYDVNVIGLSAEDLSSTSSDDSSPTLGEISEEANSGSSSGSSGGSSSTSADDSSDSGDDSGSLGGSSDSSGSSDGDSSGSSESSSSSE